MGSRGVGPALVVAAVAVAALAASPGRLRADARTPASPLRGPLSIAAAPGGSLWVVDQQGVLRVGTNGAMTRVVSVQNAWRIARGPDGAMWFTVSSPPRIGRVSPNGQVSYFPTNRVPDDIVAGGDGNLWFTEGALSSDDHGRIGRITPGGVVTELERGLLHAAAPNQITRGPAGDLWFTDYEGRIGHVTLTGAIHEYRVAADQPQDIVAGSDGTLWFDWYQHIGRITPHGRLTVYGSPFDLPDGLTRGSDGNVWITGYPGYLDVTAGIARITQRGRVRVFRRGFSGDSTKDITLGPGGRDLWLVETGRTGDHVVRVSRSGGATEYPPPPPCRVPALARLPLLWARDKLFNALCRLDRANARTGRQHGVVALHAHPAAGSVRPYGSVVRVDFGPVPRLPRRCRLPFGGHVLTSTARMLVFTYTHYSEDDLSAYNLAYGACLRPRGRVHRIATAANQLLLLSEATGFQASGDFVAYRYLFEDHYNQSRLSLNVFDVKQVRRTFSTTVETHEGDFGPDPPDNPTLGEYALSPRGAIAWFSVAGDTTRLYAYLHGRAQLLDSGRLSQLRFKGDTLSWINDGTTKSAVVS